MRTYAPAGVERVVEYRVDAVTAHFHDPSPISLHASADDGVVTGQRRPHFVRRGLPQASAALDVGKKISRDCGTVGHVAALEHVTADWLL